MKVAIKTQIQPYPGSTPAEDYHQKFHFTDEYVLMEEFKKEVDSYGLVHPSRLFTPGNSISQEILFY